MKVEHYLKKLHGSKEYKKFIDKHKKSRLCAGFFVLDYETGKHMHQLDYILPNGKIATFFLDEGVKMKISEQTLKKELPELKTEIKTDLDSLKGIVEDEMKNRTVTEKIKKVIAILHILDGKPVWNLQCILDGLSLLNVHVNDADKSILKFEKHSLMEFIKPALSSMQMQGQMPQVQSQMPAQMPAAQEEGKPEISQEDIKAIQEKIEKVKEELKEKAKEKSEKVKKVKKK
jgi:hypothetical protein